MGMGSRLGLLILTAILGGSIPPYRPPGPPSPDDDFERAICPVCQNESDMKSGSLFYCEYCDEYFEP